MIEWLNANSEQINDILRGVMFPFVLATFWWTRTGPMDLVRGKVCPTSFNRAGYFLMALAVSGFSTLYFLNPTLAVVGPWSMMFLVLLMAGMGSGFTGWKLGHVGLIDKFFWLVTGNHLKVALAMAQYHVIFPKEAEALAHEITARCAKAMSERVS